MSLINQMLRDLESRRTTPAMAGGGVAPLALAAQRAADPRATDAPVQRTDAGRSGGVHRWMIAVIALLLVLLGLLLWSSQPPWQENMPPVNTAAADPVARVPVVAMTVEPVIPVSDTPAEPVASVPVTPTEPSASVSVMSVEPDAAVEKIVVEPPPRPVPVGAPTSQSPILSPEPSTSRPETRVQSASKPSLPVAPVQAPAADTLVNKRIRPLNNEQRAEQTLRRGVGLLGQGRQAEAEQALREALQMDPRQLRARETLAALYFNSGRLSEAQALLAEGVRLSPRAAGLVQFYARLMADQGELDTALTALQRARPPLEENPDYHALLAALYQRAGRHEPAAWTYRQLLAQRGTQAAWWMGLGISLEALGDTAPALEAYVKAHQLGGGLNSQVLDYLGSRIRVLAPRLAAAKRAAAKTAAEAAKKEE